MPHASKRTVTKKVKAPKVIEVVEESPKTSPKFIVFVLIVTILTLVVWKNKGMFVAGMVNNRPIWRISLDQKLVARYGQDTLDELIGETVIRQAGEKNKIKISSAEIDGKVAEVEKTLGDKITLKDALAQQGLTIEEYRQRIEMQLILERLTADKTLVTTQEVDTYIVENRERLTATDEAALKEEARKILFEQKQSTAIRQYFTDLKTQASVLKFL